MPLRSFWPELVETSLHFVDKTKLVFCFVLPSSSTSRSSIHSWQKYHHHHNDQNEHNHNYNYAKKKWKCQFESLSKQHRVREKDMYRGKTIFCRFSGLPLLCLLSTRGLCCWGLGDTTGWASCSLVSILNSSLLECWWEGRERLGLDEIGSVQPVKNVL